VKRTNEEWLADLRAQGAQQEAALAELHRIILAGLPYALDKWLKPNDPRFNSLAEEVAQDSVLRVMARLDSFEGRSQFTTWVHTIAVRIALTELRRAKWQEVSLDEMTDGNEPGQFSKEIPEKTASIEQVIERNSLMAMIQKMLVEDLTERQRAALVAVAVKGVPLEEVARRMGTERNTLYKLLHDARLKMKKRLEQEGLSPAEVLASFSEG
jgi:RNA polymerase sigma-70 factor (ECF subfamily)